MAGCMLLEVDWSALGSLLSGIGAVGLAILAWQGLHAWREQKVASRQMDLAGELLTSIYEVERIVMSMMVPMVFANELARIPRLEGETDDQFRLRSSYAGPRLRYSESIDKFAHLQMLSFKSKALIDGETFEICKEILNIPHEVFAIYDKALRLNTQVERQMAADERKKETSPYTARLQADLYEAQDQLYAYNAGSRISQQLGAVVSRAEAKLRPLL